MFILRLRKTQKSFIDKYILRKIDEKCIISVITELIPKDLSYLIQRSDMLSIYYIERHGH